MSPLCLSPLFHTLSHFSLIRYAFTANRMRIWPNGGIKKGNGNLKPSRLAENLRSVWSVRGWGGGQGKKFPLPSTLGARFHPTEGCGSEQTLAPTPDSPVVGSSEWRLNCRLQREARLMVTAEILWEKRRFSTVRSLGYEPEGRTV